MVLNQEQIDLLEEFIFDIYDCEDGKNSFLYLQKDGTYYKKDRIQCKASEILPKRESTKTLLQKILEIIEMDKEGYFKPNVFLNNKNKSIEGKYIKGSKVLFLDIDKIQKTLDTKEKIVEFLEQYPFIKKGVFYPSYATFSGHGLHLYFMIDYVPLTYPIQKEQYKNLLRKLCSFIKGDFKCADMTRVLRLPFTCNCKDPKNLIHTQFFSLKDIYEDDDWICDKSKKTLDEIECYLSKFDTENTNEVKESKEKKSKEKKQKEPKIKIEYTYEITEERAKRIESYIPKTKNKVQRLFDRINYLEKTLLPYREYDIFGYRNSFIFIITKLYQNAFKTMEETLNHCLELNSSFKEPLTQIEVENIVKYTYEDNKNPYIRITNKGIKRLLDITPEEQDLDYGVVFYDEVREYKKTLRYKKSNQKKKVKKQLDIVPSTMEIKYMKYFQILEQNPNATNKELAKLLDLSTKQITRIKNKYKEYLCVKKECA